MFKRNEDDFLCTNKCYNAASTAAAAAASAVF